MREIKFRAWDITQKLMLPEVAIYFPSDHIGFGVDDYIKWSGGGDLPDHVETGEYDWAYLTDGFELMQYTGLKDKNGVEIYEGDILINRLSEGNFLVRWSNRKLRYYAVTNDNRNVYFDADPLVRDWLVIGNIYETPELLEKS